MSWAAISILPMTTASASMVSFRVAMCLRGTMSTCSGAWGLMSRKAMSSGVSSTSCGLISPLAILQNRQSFMGPPSADVLSAGECMGQGAAVYEFQFATDGHAVGDARGAYAAAPRQLSQVMGRGFALHRGIGGEDDLAHATL